MIKKIKVEQLEPGMYVRVGAAYPDLTAAFASGAHHVTQPPLQALKDSVPHSTDPQVRFAVLLRGLGQDLSRAQRLAQTGALCSRYRAPNDYTWLATHAIRHENDVLSNNPGELLALMESASAFRHEQRWRQLLETYRAADLIDTARNIARGLHLDTSAIDHTAQKHAAMTRFEDVTPEDRGAFRRAVGHSVRVTLTNRDVLSGRLEAFEDNTLLLEVHSGVEGGGVQFSKWIPLAMVRELRIFDAERPSETVLGQ